ncbi:hypothetical protein DW886_31605 [Enterocloster aldenensis]|uniref:pentapeptide repeat-containing protein n=1 Tax=Enterocloster aldenensis TaxID=358742 RepID=UPI000E4BABF1|nr:hypothetical protein DW886_31605 [Enterocloster aldenensis]
MRHTVPNTFHMIFIDCCSFSFVTNIVPLQLLPDFKGVFILLHSSLTAFSRRGLPGASLSGAALSDASLSSASLSGASLPGAALPGAALSGASLPDAALSGVSLPGAASLTSIS